eukprot:Gb_17294 [translate_table: standard]
MAYLNISRRFIHSLPVKTSPRLPNWNPWHNDDVSSLCKEGRLKEALAMVHLMNQQGIAVDYDTYAYLLQACNNIKALVEGKQLHAYMLVAGLEPNSFVGTQLVGMYATCGNIANARLVFDKIYERTPILWNAMIRMYAKNGPCEEALSLYYQMQQEGTRPDNFTFPLVLKACAALLALQEGKEIHYHIVRSRLESDVFVAAGLIDMYAKCGCIEDARQVFDKMSRRDLVSWNTMIAGYAKCGNVEIARHLFDRMPERNVVSWTAMIAGYVQNGYFNEALTLYDQMQQTEIKPNRVTLVSVLPACAHLGALQQGKWIHDYVIRSGLESDVSLQTALVNMYAKCGQLDVARHLFDKMSKRDIVSWNAMIAGYGMHGHGEDAIALFVQMQQTGLKPDDVTFIGVLSACSHTGLVDEGWQYFDCMRQDYSLTPKMEHYACMVDLLGRAGQLSEAQYFVGNMPFEPSPSVWGALLAACRVHGNIELAEHVSERLFELEPYNTGNYVLLSNMYAEAGRWDNVEKVRIMLKGRGLKKNPGCSWIEINNRVHAFRGGDKSHPQSEKIYALLENLAGQMKKAGYEPDTSFVLHDVEAEEKEFALFSHSERLAIAFGILNTGPGTLIQISKNLRVCGDCHTATKFISKIVRREIIVRDINRFHHFKDGLCSCGDYW